MKEEKLNYFRDRLKEMEKDLIESLEQSDYTTNPISPDSSLGRLTRLEAMQSQQMSFEARRRQKKRLKSVQKALELVEQGKYGICMKCEKEIPEGRLESMPETRICVECAPK